MHINKCNVHTIHTESEQRIVKYDSKCINLNKNCNKFANDWCIQLDILIAQLVMSMNLIPFFIAIYNGYLKIDQSSISFMVILLRYFFVLFQFKERWQVYRYTN